MPHDPQLSAEAFRREAAGRLEPLTPGLVGVLRRMVRYPYPPQVVRIEFDVFEDGFTSGFPVRAYFFDADYSEFFVYKDGKAEYPCDGDPGLLQIPHVYPRELPAPYKEADPEFDHWTAAGETLIGWFDRCWEAAGGRAFTREANIGIHDAARRLDLVRGEWRAP